jgi:tetratricopeptide (TPR) repeat protein
MRAQLEPWQRQSVAHEAFLQALILDEQGQSQHSVEALLSALYYDDSDRWLLLFTARKMRDVRRSQDAISLVKKALALPGASADEWELLAGLWLDLGKSDSARMALSRALEFNPDSRQALVGLAVLAEREGMPNEAASQYARLALLSENSDAFAQKAYQIWSRTNRNDSILALSQALWKRKPSLRDGLIASELMARKQMPGWLAIVEALPTSRDDNDSMRTTVHRIRCYWLSKQPDSAREALHLAIRSTTAEADLPLIGGLQFENDSGEVLRGMLHQIRTQDPSWRIPLMLGTLHLSRSQSDSAVAWLDLSLQSDSTQSAAWMRRATVELPKEDPLPLAQLSRQFVRHCPKDPQARWLAAQSLEKLAQSRLRSKPWETVPADQEPEATAIRREALQHLQVVETLDTNGRQARFERAALLERLGESRASDSLLRKLIAEDSTNHTAMNYLGYVLADRNEHLDEAAILLDRALRLSPNNGAYLDSRGWLRFRLGQFQLALDDINAAMNAHRSDEIILEHRARILESMGMTQDAIRDWTLLLERAPGYRAAQDALQRLQPSPRSPLP